MTIDIKIIGTKQELEKYFKTKLLNKNSREVIEKQISKQMKSELDFTNMQMESSLCFSDSPIYTLVFQRLGACYIPTPIKKRKSTKSK